MMTVQAKQIIKRLLPPLFIDLIRRRPLFPISEIAWEGIYPHLRNVPTEGGFYDNNARVQEFVDRTRAALALVNAGKKPSLCWHEALGLLAATVSADLNRIRILDFGGGVGLAFTELIATLRCDTPIYYHVVDLEKMCVAGRQLFANDTRVEFHSSLPPLENGLDIVYLGSVLPYIEDYPRLLHQLAALNAPFILLTQLASGSFPTYAARQVNLAGQVLPYWFLNLQELVKILAASGYSIVYDAQSGPEYDQSNYPESHRIGRMRNLLFVRTKSGRVGKESP